MASKAVAITVPGMKVTVNGDEREFDSTGLTVRELLAAMDVDQTAGTAVARNAQVVPRSDWDEEVVVDGDEIEIVRATQGG